MTSREFKRKFLRLFFVIEIFVFGLTYFWGAHGIKALFNVKKNNIALESKINILQQEIIDIQYQIEQWHVHPFYREQIAREKLQMARKDDTIYFID